jgi:hypothetical protein
MDDHRRLRTLAAVTLLVLFAGAGSLRSLWRTAPELWSRRAPDPVTVNDRRFAPVLRALPAHGVVGYLSSLPSDKLFNSALGVAHFYLTQYALSPVIVVNDANRELVVADAYRGRRIAAPPPLVLLRDFGNGVALFVRKGS